MSQYNFALFSAYASVAKVLVRVEIRIGELQGFVSFSSKDLNFKGQKSGCGFLKAVRNKSHAITAIENILEYLVV